MEYDASLFDESIFADSAIAELAKSQWTFEDSTACDEIVPDDQLRREQFDCVLAAGDAGDFQGIRAWCAALPEDAYGQIFIEVFSPIQIESLDAPTGVSVTWICREQRRGSTLPGLGAAHCEALMHAVDGWLDEWYRAEHGPERHFTIYMGARGSSIMRSYWRGVEAEVAEAWAQRR